jgi:hypothetical protein
MSSDEFDLFCTYMYLSGNKRVKSKLSIFLVFLAATRLNKYFSKVNPSSSTRKLLRRYKLQPQGCLISTLCSIPPRYYCRELCWSISEIQYKTKTLILLPGDGKYDDFSDLVDKLKTGDSNSVVKIIGTLDAFMQARMDLEVRVTNVLGAPTDYIAVERARSAI